MMTRSSYRHLTSLILTFLIQGAFAASIVVNTTTDDENAGDGKCTLREAVNNANTDSDTTKKDCKSGSAIDVINLTNLHGQITLTYGELKILSDIRFQGADANTLIISGNKQSRIFKIESGQVEIDKVTIANGKEYKYCPKELPITAGRGGGIYNSSNLIIRNSTISNNVAHGYDCLFDDGYSASSAEGGGIYNEGTLTIEQVTFSGNLAYSGELSEPNYCTGYEALGGGIYNSGTLIVRKGIFSNNSAMGSDCLWTLYGNSGSGEGGGIYSRNGILIVESSTFSKNLAQSGQIETWYDSSVGSARGGGIYLGFSYLGNSIANSTFIENSAKGGSSANYMGDATGGNGFGGGISTWMTSLEIINSTFSQNLVKGGDQTVGGLGGESYGGGIYIGYDTGFLITNSTLFGNSAIGGEGDGDISKNGESHGGGIGGNHENSFLEFKNTIIAKSTGGDCYMMDSSIYDNRANLIEDASCYPEYSGDPNLGPLANNGGLTETHMPLEGSMAIDAGDNTVCPEYDQRGTEFPRPIDENRDGKAICDIGAVEVKRIGCDDNQHATFSLASGKLTIPFVDIPENGKEIVYQGQLLMDNNGDFKVSLPTLKIKTNEVPDQFCHAVYSPGTKTLTIPFVDVHSVINTWPNYPSASIEEGLPINILEVTFDHIQVHEVLKDYSLFRLKNYRLLSVIE